ncbi:hypothetical protein [Cupriavidus oxalaticus]|uniref:5-formyltetrahydrofolate cyclo-ligase n=1 Tax=Cupriavidus oxalaticus TaxID=96344 RepID=A0A4P7L8U4_9BURK|nr:hypothetical protein [Cupriavidus oxalaticus]QBY51765.1 hypothetical protein E0W60_10965 [Cupriavidus oxalaticus]
MTNRIHRRTLLTLAALTLLGTGGCATKALMDKATKTEYRRYEETVSQVLVTADGKRLAVLGPKYHYIFDVPEGLVQLLDSPLHRKMSARFDVFNVKANGDVEGPFALILEQASQEDRLAAKAFGFTDLSTTRAVRWFALQGSRYSAAKFSMPAGTRPLNQPYRVEVREALPNGAREALVVMTPLTVAADGALILLAIPLIPLALVVMRDLQTLPIGF